MTKPPSQNLYLTDSSASPVRWWGKCCWMKAGSGRAQCTGGWALWVLEESHWKCPRSEGRKLPKGLQWAEFFFYFECECGTWQQHLSLQEVREMSMRSRETFKQMHILWAYQFVMLSICPHSNIREHDHMWSDTSHSKHALCVKLDWSTAALIHSNITIPR